MSDLGTDVRAIADLARSIAEGTSQAAAVDAVRRRLDDPLRVAIAGRVKAGKSTLLNALVGERLAPTDAGECTRIVTWYRKGASYGVNAHLRNGKDQSLAFKRGEGARAQSLATEHTQVAQMNMRLALERRSESEQVMPLMRLVVG